MLPLPTYRRPARARTREASKLGRRSSLVTRTALKSPTVAEKIMCPPSYSKAALPQASSAEAPNCCRRGVCARTSCCSGTSEHDFAPLSIVAQGNVCARRSGRRGLACTGSQGAWCKRGGRGVRGRRACAARAGGALSARGRGARMCPGGGSARRVGRAVRAPTPQGRGRAGALASGRRARCWPTPSDLLRIWDTCWSGLANTWPDSPKFGRFRAAIGGLRTRSPQCGPDLAELASKPPEVGRLAPNNSSRNGHRSDRVPETQVAGSCSTTALGTQIAARTIFEDALSISSPTPSHSPRGVPEMDLSSLWG